MNKQIFRRPRKGEGGWLLVELALVLLVLALLSARDVVKKVDGLADQRAVAAATGLDVVRKAGNDYIASYYSQINAQASGQPMTVGTVTVANAVKPTIGELVSLGKLPAGTTARSLVPGGDYRMFIFTNPSTCTLPSTPGSTCNLDGLVCVNAPLLFKNKVDHVRLGLASKEIGADGGASQSALPGTISGLGGTWTAPNPLGSVAGLLCARIGYSSSGFAQFLRKDGSVAMTGNLNVGGNSLTNVQNLNATGTLQGGQLVTDIKTVGSACDRVGAIASGAGVAMICDGTKWQVDTGIRATAGAACSPEGATATSVANGEALVCRNGRYVKLLNLLGKKVLVSSMLVQDGTYVGMPACDTGGTPDFSFDVTQVTLDLTTSPPKQTAYWTAINASATTWYIKIRLRDNNGNEMSGNNVGLTAVFNLECRY